MKTMTDPRCGKVSRANDRDGHCCSCHLTWVGESAFTAHQHLVDGDLVCDDPETTLKVNGERKFYPRPRPGTSDGVAWGLGPPLDVNGAPWWDSSPSEGMPGDSGPQEPCVDPGCPIPLLHTHTWLNPEVNRYPEYRGEDS